MLIGATAMRTVTIKQAPHTTALDIQSEHRDIIIHIPTDGYVVCLPDYYAHHPYNCADVWELYDTMEQLRGYAGIVVYADTGEVIDVTLLDGCLRVGDEDYCRDE